VLAGRDGRFTQPSHDTFDALAQDLWQQLRAVFDTGRRPRDLVLFGFSMGALLAARMAEHLQAEAAGPRALVVAGCPPPHLLRGTRRSTLPDQELVADLASHGVTPELMSNPELVRMMMPTWRADCAAIESHDRRPSVLRCPVFALGGRDDPLAAPDDVAVWARMGGPGSAVRIVPGGHADVLNATGALVGALTQASGRPGQQPFEVSRRDEVHSDSHIPLAE
jgi:surfactin synthase thioesterase subunit